MSVARADEVGTPPAISVVMTTFNSARHVREAVASIVAQSFGDWELIVVDDGSTDETLSIIESFRDSRIRLLTVPRSNRIACLNRGFHDARADLIANMDSDDVALPERLALTRRAMGAHPEWALVGSATVPLIDAQGAELGRRIRPTEPRALRRALGYSMPFFHSTCTYRRQAWQECGGFDESLPLLEDYDLWVRLSAQHEVANILDPMGLKRRHAAQGFDEAHWTNRGYRTRARILRTYFRLVRRDPRVLLRAGLYQIMGPRMRVAWMRLTGRDATEMRVRRRLRH